MGSEDLRIGDAEREAALQALGEHFGAGRLTVDEYGERTAQVATAKTGGELARQFADLPPPHPQPVAAAPPPPSVPAAPVSRPAAAPVGAVAGQRDPGVEQWLARPPIQRAAGALVGASWLIGLGLMIGLHGAWVFLFLPMVLSAVFGSVWGGGWERDRHAYRRSNRRHR